MIKDYGLTEIRTTTDNWQHGGIFNKSVFVGSLPTKTLSPTQPISTGINSFLITPPIGNVLRILPMSTISSSSLIFRVTGWTKSDVVDVLGDISSIWVPTALHLSNINFGGTVLSGGVLASMFTPVVIAPTHGNALIYQGATAFPGHIAVDMLGSQLIGVDLSRASGAAGDFNFFYGVV